MNQLLLSIALAIPMVAQLNQPAKDREKLPMRNIEGQWTVTYAEMDGKKVEGKGFTQVSIKNNVHTCQHDGKQKSWRLELGPRHIVRCTEQMDGKATTESAQAKTDVADKSQHTHHGV